MAQVVAPILFAHRDLTLRGTGNPESEKRHSAVLFGVWVVFTSWAFWQKTEEERERKKEEEEREKRAEFNPSSRVAQPICVTASSFMLLLRLFL